MGRLVVRRLAPALRRLGRQLDERLGGASVAVLFLLGCELGFGLRPSLAMAGLAGLATPLLPYAKTFFAEPLAGLGLVSFVLLLVRAGRRERGTGWLFGAGLALGVCVLAKIAHAVLLPPGVVLAAALLRRRERVFASAATARARVRALAAFGRGLALPLAAIAAYDFFRFGTPFETGYAGEVQQWTTPFAEGFAGLLLSPGRGLFWYAPIVLVSLLQARRFARRFPAPSPSRRPGRRATTTWSGGTGASRRWSRAGASR